jgi:ribosomal protein L11 methylase PrmA
VTANLTRRLLLEVAQSWAGRGERPGIVIVSGLLRTEADEAAAGLAAAGLAERRRLASGDWAAIMAS